MSKDAPTAIVVRPTTEIAERPDDRGSGVVLRSFDDHVRFAKAAAIAGCAGKGNQEAMAAQAFMKIQYGAEMGMGPMSSLANVYLIDQPGGGVRPAPSAHLIRARLDNVGVSVTFIEHTTRVCELRFARDGKDLGPPVRFTMDDAKESGAQLKTLKGKPTNWAKYPRNMLYARALTNGAKWYCAWAFGGSVYTPDEIASGAAALDAPVPSLPEETTAPEPQSTTTPPPAGRIEPDHEPDPSLKKGQPAGNTSELKYRDHRLCEARIAQMATVGNCEFWYRSPAMAAHRAVWTAKQRADVDAWLHDQMASIRRECEHAAYTDGGRCKVCSLTQEMAERERDQRNAKPDKDASAYGGDAYEHAQQIAEGPPADDVEREAGEQF